MAEFTNDFWNNYIALLTLLGAVGCCIQLFSQSRSRLASTGADGNVDNDNWSCIVKKARSGTENIHG